MTAPRITGHGLRRFAASYWGVAAVLVAWQAWVTIGGLNAVVLPGPVSVFADILSHPLLYLANGAQTLSLAAAGFAIGLAAGLLLAVAAWASALIGGLLTPVGLVFSSIPVVALIPIIARLAGYGPGTVITIVAISAFFPTFVFAGNGLRSQPAGADDLFRVLGASRFQRFRRLVLPAALPKIMIAVRLTAPEAVLAAILAELLMGSSGLGYVLRQSASRFETERAFGTSVVATIISVTCFGLAIAAERRVTRRWS